MSGTSYVARHWRGELSLPRSYWINGWAATLAVLLPFLATLLIDVTRFSRIWGIWIIACWCWASIVHCWSLVGVWRSSRSHGARGGSEFWAAAARTVVFFGVLSSLFALGFRGLPQMIEGGRIAFGPSEIDDSRIRVIRGGTEIEVNGLLGFGVSRRFAQVLAENPGVHIVHLNSNGGRAAEAKALAEEIERRGLVTYVATECQSGCVLAFAAGQDRWLSRRAVIGLHAPSMPGLTSDEVHRQSAWQREYLIRRGVDSDFIERGYATPSGDMWQPSHPEIFAAGLASRYAPPGSVGISGVAAAPMNETMEVLAALPVYAALREADPAAYSAVMTLFEQGFEKGTTMEEVRAAAFPLWSSVVARSLPRASAPALRQYVEVLVAEAKTLQAIGPPECVSFFSDAPPLEMMRHIPAELVQRELAAEAEVLLSAARSPTDPIPIDLLGERLDAALQAMPAGTRADLGLSDRPEELAAHPERYCAALIALYEALLAQPDDEMGTLLRAMFAGRE